MNRPIDNHNFFSISQMMFNRESETSFLKGVFYDTISCCRNGGYEIEPFKVVALPLPAEGSRETVHWKSIRRTETFPKLPRGCKTKVEVINMDTALAGHRLLTKGLNPAVLNLASCWQPGGGVLDGRTTQEESLFRRSTLASSLFPFDRERADEFGFPFVEQAYPNRSEILKSKKNVDTSREGRTFLSRGVVFFKDTEKNNCRLLKNPYRLDVVSVCAIKKPALTKEGLLTYRDRDIVRRKIRSMFKIALWNGNDSMVLGAWGCGAYRNPPSEIAALFREALLSDEFRNRFKSVTFAILSKSDSKLAIFRDILVGKHS